MARRHSYYQIDTAPEKKRSSKFIFSITASVLFVLIGGIYLFVLTQSPDILIDNPESVKSKEEILVREGQDFVKLNKINLLLPFEKEPKGGHLTNIANWLSPEKGNPADGGSFVLCGSRYNLAVTPQKTKEESPLYHINKLHKGDTIEVFYKEQWYSYQITESGAMSPSDGDGRSLPNEAKLTLYTCTKEGKADGTATITAKPQVRQDLLIDNAGGGSNLL